MSLLDDRQCGGRSEHTPCTRRAATGNNQPGGPSVNANIPRHVVHLLYGLLICAGGAACRQDSAGPPAGGSATEVDAQRTVTLITGDRVTLAGEGDATDVRIAPGPGRDGISFTTLHHG